MTISGIEARNIAVMLLRARDPETGTAEALRGRIPELSDPTNQELVLGSLLGLFYRFADFVDDAAKVPGIIERSAHEGVSLFDEFLNFALEDDDDVDGGDASV